MAGNGVPDHLKLSDHPHRHRAPQNFVELAGIFMVQKGEARPVSHQAGLSPGTGLARCKGNLRLIVPDQGRQLLLNRPGVNSGEPEQCGQDVDSGKQCV